MRREFGTVLRLRRADGSPGGWRARYVNPRDPSKRVSKCFPRGQRAAAYLWLERERLLVDRDAMGIETWTPPSERKAAAAVPVRSVPSFGEFARAWVDAYRCPDGHEPRGATMRNIRADVSHLVDRFGDVPVDAIDSAMLHEWFDGPHGEGATSFERQCVRMKAILRAAQEGTVGGWGKVIGSSPWDMRIPGAPEGARERVEPLTAVQIEAIYEGMPGYDRLSVWLAVLCGGLRIGEVCGLRIGDVDLDALTLHVAHSVNRGAQDRGPERLCPPKTARSDRVVGVPERLAPLIRDHIERHCDPSSPMLFQPVRSRVMSPTTLQKQFHRAEVAAGRPDVTFHTLRATHATMLFLCGGTLRECMDDLGHASEAVAVRHYQRVVPAHRREVNATLAVRLLG